MVGWIILGVLVGLIILILLIPVGVDLRYEDGVIRVSLKASFLNLQLIPKPKKKPKKEKPEKEKKPKEEKPKEEKPKKEKDGKKSFPFNLEEIIDLLKSVIKGLGHFSRKIKVERFVLHWIAAGYDPYNTARLFAVVNAGLSELAPVCTERFHCRDSSVWTDIDFTQEDMFFEFGLRMTIRIGQILMAALIIAFGALKIYLRSKSRRKREAKEEEKALNKWLEEHPEDAARLAEEEKAALEAARQEEAKQLEEEKTA